MPVQFRRGLNLRSREGEHKQRTNELYIEQYILPEAKLYYFSTAVKAIYVYMWRCYSYNGSIYF